MLKVVCTTTHGIYRKEIDMTPREAFGRLTSGIINIIRAADIYLLHILSDLRNEPVPVEVIKRLMSGNISGYNLIGGLYNEDELRHLQERGHLREIGQQVILSTYVAIEFYLIEKFKEYLTHKLASVDAHIAEKLLRRISFRNLDEIKDNYQQYLGIYLLFFDYEFSSDEKSSFHPPNSWAAIQMLSMARNELAHTGTSSSYRVVTLLDVWYPFDFVRGWVPRFERSFDDFVYHGSSKWLPKEYSAKVEAAQRTGGVGREKSRPRRSP